MLNGKKIIVVMPAYNAAKKIFSVFERIPEEIWSGDVAFIIVNDGSTDDTQEIAERYMFKDFPGIESPVKVIHQVNKGLPSARNTGIMNATGDYILFLDADDMLTENALLTHAALAKAREG